MFVPLHQCSKCRFSFPVSGPSTCLDPPSRTYTTLRAFFASILRTPFPLQKYTICSLLRHSPNLASLVEPLPKRPTGFACRVCPFIPPVRSVIQCLVYASRVALRVLYALLSIKLLSQHNTPPSAMLFRLHAPHSPPRSASSKLNHPRLSLEIALLEPLATFGVRYSSGSDSCMLCTRKAESRFWTPVLDFVVFLGLLVIFRACSGVVDGWIRCDPLWNKNY